MNASIKIDLLKLKASVKKLKGKTGDIECIVIPIDLNSIYRGEKGMYLDIQAYQIQNKVGDSKDTHLLKQSMPKEVYEKMTEEEKRALPILGNMTVYGEATNPVEVLEDSDDLPWG